MTRRRRLPRSFFDRDPVVVAPELLNKLFVVGECSGRIIEVEAYDGANDPASHAFRGQTPRTAAMFGKPGGFYVYFTYGMHYCCNFVCRSEGTAAAVLIRALVPVDGIDVMRTRRGDLRHGDKHLTSGPARLCQALGVDRSFDGIDLIRNDRGVSVLDEGVDPPAHPEISKRIGIRVGTELPWRFCL
jgi:DNA-3-methyladenine glycosylase